MPTKIVDAPKSGINHDMAALFAYVLDRLGPGGSLSIDYSRGEWSARWRRDYDGVESDERTTASPSLRELLHRIVEHEDAADEADRREEFYAPATSDTIADLIAKLSDLTEEQRLDVISEFCSCCGGDRSCNCWND